MYDASIQLLQKMWGPSENELPHTSVTVPDELRNDAKQTGGGAHGVLVTAVSTAFAQALRIARRKGTVSLVGLPPGDFPTPIFEVVLKRLELMTDPENVAAQGVAEKVGFRREAVLRSNLEYRDGSRRDGASGREVPFRRVHAAVPEAREAAMRRRAAARDR